VRCRYVRPPCSQWLHLTTPTSGEPLCNIGAVRPTALTTQANGSTTGSGRALAPTSRAACATTLVQLTQPDKDTYSELVIAPLEQAVYGTGWTLVVLAPPKKHGGTQRFRPASQYVLISFDKMTSVLVGFLKYSESVTGSIFRPLPDGTWIALRIHSAEMALIWSERRSGGPDRLRCSPTLKFRPHFPGNYYMYRMMSARECNALKLKSGHGCIVEVSWLSEPHLYDHTLTTRPADPAPRTPYADDPQTGMVDEVPFIDESLWNGSYGLELDDYKRMCARAELVLPIELPLPEEFGLYPTANQADPCPTFWNTEF